MRHLYTAILSFSLLLAWPAGLAAAEDITFKDSLKLTDSDHTILSAFIGHAVDYAKSQNPQKVRSECDKAPEMFAWVQFKYLNCLNIAYELTGETKYLDLFADTFDIFVDITTAEADEYLGWYGSPIKPRIPADNPDIRIDEIQMNFRGMSAMAKWIELARSDSEYAAAKQATIDRYLELMEKHIFPKWDKRGHFSEVPGRGGAYHGLDFPLKGQVSLSFEKLSIMVDGLVKLYHITGDDKYMRRALQIGTWYKSNLMLKDGHYEWMSWVPAGKWDISPSKPDSWKVSWMAPDPKAGWYVTSMSIALTLYQHGLLFDDTDLQRFIKTQKTMCWNGDMEKPVYRNVAGETGKWIKGRFLSHQLSCYDPDLTKLAFYGPHEADALKNASSSWQGCANAQEYVSEKFLVLPIVKEKKIPYAKYGEMFLSDPENKAFYDSLNFEVKAPGASAPRKPSQADYIK